ncbi:MAG: DinB family protein [Acidobacteria bacterium]|nr:DinB family protein [Acidobacteriota bacterium]MBK8148485.1 DinB family protein [Acidobacteriota bacterium]MBK8813237.1 DinB family protein [Acidobacteriota bacterium]
MDTIEHLRQLFAWNDWANRRIVTALKETPNGRALKVLAHIVTTELEYFDRLYGKDSKGFDFRPDLTLEECGDRAREAAEKFERLLRKFDDEGLDLTARYRTSEGVWCENTYREMLTHVLFHSANHRGNINTCLRDAGVTPPATDYIIYLRETKYF